MALLSLPPIVLSLARTDSVHFSRFVLSGLSLSLSLSLSHQARQSLSEVLIIPHYLFCNRIPVNRISPLPAAASAISEPPSFSFESESSSSIAPSPQPSQPLPSHPLSIIISCSCCIWMQAEAATVGKVRHRRLVREMRGCWWHNACLIILSLSTSFPGKACPQATSCFL
ncbi:uncharacterized protein LOC103940662 isoform X4 [Pyrus x bretschneideri]|uniref:uncharacterized protein LOC103940662 isoform X4 n=1 Tax=Pyrus x bretschneideri TaxID=225117 RepID=UPI00202FA069|nr:uncharacterized protein LOC103940662 isoform X4 [Pyrus x bretschneideri]